MKLKFHFVAFWFSLKGNSENNRKHFVICILSKQLCAPLLKPTSTFDNREMLVLKIQQRWIESCDDKYRTHGSVHKYHLHNFFYETIRVQRSKISSSPDSRRVLFLLNQVGHLKIVLSHHNCISIVLARGRYVLVQVSVKNKPKGIEPSRTALSWSNT